MGELVRQFDKPLSSDAFTLFGEHNSDLHDAEVREATELLHREIIPSFARSLSQLDKELRMEDILIRLHRAGINIRFLGEVRSHVTNEAQRKLLLTEIYARVFKNEIRRKLRDCKSPHASAYAQLCLNFLNTIFGSQPVSNILWTAMKKPLQRRFPSALSTEEQRGVDLRAHVNMEMLFARLQSTLGVTFNASFSDFPLSLSHFREFVVQTKQMYTVPRIEADTAAELARTTKDVMERRRLLSLAREKYHSVLELKPDDHIVLSNLGMVMAETAMLEADESQRRELFEESNERFRASLQLHANDPHSLVMWSDVLINQVILLENSDDTLLDQAMQMGLQAEAVTSGIGALAIARVSALQGGGREVKRWLRHASLTGNLTSVEAIIHDPAFAVLTKTKWFRPFLEDITGRSEAMSNVD